MDTTVSSSVRKWIKKCLKEEFEQAVKDGLESEKSTYAVAEGIMQSPEMEVLLRSMRLALEDRGGGFSGRSSALTESRPRTSTSFGSDLSSEDWSPYKVPPDQYACVIEKISYDKPVHVRLAGYERLLESELSNVGKTDSWDILLKTLRDGVADESRPVFEASLRVHAKLLTGSRAHDVYMNLLSAFNAQFHSRKLSESLVKVFFLLENVIEMHTVRIGSYRFIYSICPGLEQFVNRIFIFNLFSYLFFYGINMILIHYRYEYSLGNSYHFF